MRTVVVTGSSGFVGRHLVRSLKIDGFDTIEIDIVNGNDLLKSECFSNLPKYDWVIHLASRSFVPESFKNPYQYFHDNYLSTLNVLSSALKTGAKMIYFSSYLYGVPRYLPIDENHPVSPLNPYAQTKLLGEILCQGYHRDFNLPITVLRPFNIYGPGQNEIFLIPKIVSNLRHGNVNLHDPLPRRDFIHVDDVVSAIRKVIEVDSNNLEVFNLGTGVSISVKELANTIMELTAGSYEIFFSNKIRQGEVMETVADITKASKVLNWRPCIDLYNGLKQLIKSR